MKATIYWLYAYLRLWDWRLFAFIFLFSGLPRVYEIYRVFLIGNEIPDSNALAIASQWQFVGIVTEVFQEASVLAIFFFLGSQLKRPLAEQIDRLKTVALFIILVSGVAAVGLFVFREQFVNIIGTPDAIRAETSEFLAISVFGIPFLLLSAASIVVLEALNKRKLIFALAFINVAVRYGFDSLFVGGLPFSLDGGVNGLAWAMLLANGVVFAIALTMLLISMRPSWRLLLSPPRLRGWRVYAGVGFGSGLDSLVRNFAYFFMILRLINEVGESEIAGYFLFLNIFWGFLLVPVLAFVDSARALFANHHADIPRVRSMFAASMLIVGGYMLVWVALTPLWGWFAALLNSDEGTLEVALISLGVLFVPYVMFSFNLVMDSLFYGLGKTRYLAWQSILTNGSVYLGAFLLYITDLWQPTYITILLLFGLGIVIDSFLTFLFAVKVLYFDPRRSDKLASATNET